jgi:hypothetical protein
VQLPILNSSGRKGGKYAGRAMKGRGTRQQKPTPAAAESQSVASTPVGASQSNKRTTRPCVWCVWPVACVRKLARAGGTACHPARRRMAGLAPPSGARAACGKPPAPDPRGPGRYAVPPAANLTPMRCARTAYLLFIGP